MITPRFPPAVGRYTSPTWRSPVPYLTLVALGAGVWGQASATVWPGPGFGTGCVEGAGGGAHAAAMTMRAMRAAAQMLGFRFVHMQRTVLVAAGIATGHAEWLRAATQSGCDSCAAPSAGLVARGFQLTWR